MRVMIEIDPAEVEWSAIRITSAMPQKGAECERIQLSLPRDG